MGTSVSKQSGGGYPTPLTRNAIETQIVRIARRFGLSPMLRDALSKIATDVFNHQNELTKGNTILVNLYKDKLRQAFQRAYPSKTPDAQIKINRYTEEVLESLQRLIEQNTLNRPLEAGDQVQKEHLERQMAPSLRRAKAQQGATRRWRLLQEGGFLAYFKQRSEEPTTILHKRLRRRKTQKQSRKQRSGQGLLSFLMRK